MRALIFFLSLLWILGFTYLCKNQFCGTASASSAAAVSGAAAAKGGCNPTLTLAYGDFKVSSKNNFRFKGGGIELIDEDKISSEIFSKMREFLAENPTASLLVEGIYSNKEKNPTNKDNIGVARAMVIKDYLISKHSINEDQLKIGSLPTSGCFSNKTNVLANGGKLTITLNK